jgi:uncharacterized protein YqjF (DUF2071 family)
MYQAWRNLTFLHWRYPPAVMQAHLPPGVQVDTFDGSAWLRIAPFLLELRVSTFPETNVLTYVRGPDGKSGVWFFSLDAARMAAVAGARLAYGLPYMWSRMRVQADGRRAEYESSRQWPDRRGMSRIAVERGEKIVAGDLEDFLTARFRLYSLRRGRLIYAEVEHKPWPLESARLISVEQTLTDTVGLSRPEGSPLVHFSPGIEVRAGPPVLLVRTGDDARQPD